MEKSKQFKNYHLEDRNPSSDEDYTPPPIKKRCTSHIQIDHATKTDDNNNNNDQKDESTIDKMYQNDQLPTIDRRLTQTDRDIIRITAQYLESIHLDETVRVLRLESGCSIEHPRVTKLKNSILSGKWNEALNDLLALKPFLQKNSTTYECLGKIHFLLSEQIYYKLLEDGKIEDALKLLQNELLKLDYYGDLEQMAYLLLFENKKDLQEKMNGRNDLTSLVVNINDLLVPCVPSSLMLPSNRLKYLLDQAMEYTGEDIL